MILGEWDPGTGRRPANILIKVILATELPNSISTSEPSAGGMIREPATKYEEIPNVQIFGQLLFFL